jgi:hypothetical protein
MRGMEKENRSGKSLKAKHHFGDLRVDGRIILSRFRSVTIDGVWIDEWIY